MRKQVKYQTNTGERSSISHALAQVNRTVEWLEGIGAYAAGLSILAVMLIVFLDVFLRYFFRSPFTWSYDLISLYLVPVLFFLVISETFKRNHHIAVDLLYLRFLETGKRIARLLIALLTIPIVWEIVTLSARDAIDGYRNNEVLSGAILWPTWIPLLVVVLGFGLLIVRLALDAIALIVALTFRTPEVVGESPPRRHIASHDEDIP
jgi:TRAP-type C4-dicarboxylate transport system permease small subunit